MSLHSADKPNVTRRPFTIGRVLFHFNWSLDGLWWNDAGEERFYYWLHIGTSHKGGNTGFVIIVFKAKMICGLLPCRRKES